MIHVLAEAAAPVSDPFLDWGTLIAALAAVGVSLWAALATRNIPLRVADKQAQAAREQANLEDELRAKQWHREQKYAVYTEALDSLTELVNATSDVHGSRRTNRLEQLEAARGLLQSLVAVAMLKAHRLPAFGGDAVTHQALQVIDVATTSATAAFEGTGGFSPEVSRSLLEFTQLVRYDLGLHASETEKVQLENFARQWEARRTDKAETSSEEDLLTQAKP